MKYTPVQVEQTTLTLPTYPMKAAQELPMFAEFRSHQNAGGNPYPARVVTELDHSEKTDVAWRIIRLENEFLRLEIMPDLGGRIYSALDKTTGYDFFYKQHVVKPALIGMLGMWISGGVEFNWPYHHRPSTFTPVDVKIETAPDGAVTVWMSEHEPLHHMKGMVGVRLRPGAAVFDTVMRVYNRTELRHEFLWWENAAVPVNKQYRLFFPSDVQYVQFHYRKDVQTYPIAHGMYNGIPLGVECDIRMHKNTPDPTSYFCAESDYDFFGGYDEGLRAGVVNIADHTVSIGKKMFTWAYCQLGDSWERALTDEDGAYAELMAGSYSSNQPDFTWLEPYEEKEFMQSWYPIGAMGVPLCASYDFAISQNEGKTWLHATRTFENVQVCVNGKTVMLDRISPDQDALLDVTEALQSVVVTAEGSVKLRFVPAEDEPRAIPQPLPDIPPLCRMRSAEECYLTGVHIEQYHDAVMSSAAYWKKALEFDPMHGPSLLQLARDSYARFFYPEALDYAKRAWEAFTRYNFHPESGYPAYVLGLIHSAMGSEREAWRWHMRSAWNQDTRSRAMTKAAALDGRRGDYQAMYDHAHQAVLSHAGNRTAQAQKAVAAFRLGRAEEASALLDELLAQDPLNLLAICLRERLLGQTWDYLSLTDADQNILDLAEDLEDMGENHLAAALLDERKGTFTAFPSRRSEEKRLARLYETNPADEASAYDYACILYANGHWHRAAAIWEKIGTPYALRNLAAAWYSHLGDRDKALQLLKEAHDRKPEDRQIAFELLFVMGRMNRPIEERLALADKLADMNREDIMAERARTCNLAGQHEKALEIMLSHDFTPCEGGEHAVADQYMIAKFGVGLNALARGEDQAAADALREARTLPDSLGAGLWHQALRVPAAYMEAQAHKRLGNDQAAQELYSWILNLAVEYFSDSQLLELRCYQARILREQGCAERAAAMLAEHAAIIDGMRLVKDSGYFKATPHFIVYCEDAAVERKSAADWQSAMNEWAAGRMESAQHYAIEALKGNPFLYYATFFEKGLGV